MKRQGFTLLEVMISAVVFILVLSSTMPLILMSASVGRNAFDLSRGNEAAGMVMDRIVGARQVGALLPGPGNVPADVTRAPETGEQCYYLRSDDSRAPNVEGCQELGDNALVSRSDIDDRFAVKWVTQRERSLDGAPAIDNIKVTVSWRKGSGRIRNVFGVVRVAR